jgi:nitric oxide dioxygenase
MTPDQIAAVDASVVRLAPVLDAVAGDFYARMFLAAPQVDSLFTCPPAHQRAVFVAELRQIAHLVRHHDDFVHEARELGRRHGGYGVRAAHYRLAAPHLLAALAEASGDHWNPELEEAWRLAYNLVTEAMMEGAYA